MSAKRLRKAERTSCSTQDILRPLQTGSTVANRKNAVPALSFLHTPCKAPGLGSRAKGNGSSAQTSLATVWRRLERTTEHASGFGESTFEPCKPPATVCPSKLILRRICSIGAPAAQPTSPSEPAPSVDQSLITSNGQEHEDGMG